MRRTVLLLERPEWAKARTKVDEMLASGYSFSEIVRAINGTGSAPGKLNLSTLQRYNAQRFARVSRMMEAARLQAETAHQVLLRHGTPDPGEMIRMHLVEAFLANQHKLSDADPVKLGWLQVQYENIAQHRAQLEHQKNELEAKLAEQQAKSAKARKAIDAAVAENKSIDPATLREIGEQLYGLGA